MNNWNKKTVTKQQITPLCEKFKIDQILASIFVRRDITNSKDLLYFLERDLRFQHEAFSFSVMEDAVERILQALEEGEKVLIFGDSDVDGVTSTAILYTYLKNIGLDVSWRLPLDDDPYGLSKKAVEDFYKEQGSLIITVDCGISNFEEIELAQSLGIDVIVTDHHNPQDILPNAIVVLDPKTTDSNYPFTGISGAAVAYKLVSALRFARTNFYNCEICILELTENPEEQNYAIDVIKIKNLVKIRQLHETIIPGKTSIYDLKLPYFLQGQIIYSWDAKKTKSMLASIFGSNIDFNINDLRTEIGKAIPSLKGKDSKDLISISTFAKYSETEFTIIEGLYSLYITYIKKLIHEKFPQLQNDENSDLQLVALAALADIMPMKNENRIFVSNGIASIKNDRPRQGLGELFAKLKLNSQTINSTDLSWNVIPALNAAGRLGKPDIALKLLISENPREREQYADQIYLMNEERKNLVQEAFYRIHDHAKESVAAHSGKLCVVYDQSIHHGLTGLFASKLMQDLGVPAIALTLNNDICIGSIRSCRSFIATDFLDSFGDFFINHGGHNYAAGFSFEKDKLEEFLAKIKKSAPSIILSQESENIEIDAEIPPAYLTPSVFNLIDTFEPYGNENSELVFVSRDIKLCDAMIVGKKEPMSLKLTFDSGTYKFPAMYWGQATKLKNEIQIGKMYDILYTMNRNYFNGTMTNQLIIKDIK